MKIEIESQFDCYDAICPYCGDSHQVEPESYAIDGGPELCDTCGKTYFLQTFFDVSHLSSPDCDLNGIDHDWIEAMRTRTVEAYRFCAVCGKIE